MDFYELSVKDIGDFCLCRQKKEKESYKYLSAILYRVSDKIIAGMNLKKPKNLKFDELFPEFKDTEEDKEEKIAERWRVFLKG